MGSTERATLIVRFLRMNYIAGATGITVFWYTGWRNQRIADGSNEFPFPGVKRLRAKYAADRPDSEGDPGYQGPVSGGGGGGGMAVGSPGSISAGGGYGGTEGICKALTHGTGLSWTDKRATKYTTTGSVSDHAFICEKCYAQDGKGSVTDMDRAARTIMSRLGAEYRGGTIEHTTTKNGYRIQVLYKTMLGGNHYTHIHVGVRKEGYIPNG